MIETRRQRAEREQALEWLCADFDAIFAEMKKRPPESGPVSARSLDLPIGLSHGTGRSKCGIIPPLHE